MGDDNQYVKAIEMLENLVRSNEPIIFPPLRNLMVKIIIP